MERDVEKYVKWLAENAREGVIVENMILERKLAERAQQARESKRDDEAVLKVG